MFEQTEQTEQTGLDFHDYFRDEIEANPVDVDADDTNVWPDGRGVRRAIYDARRHHTTAMGNIDAVEARLLANQPDRPQRPSRPIGRPTPRDALEHSAQVDKRVDQLFHELDVMRSTMWSVAYAFIAHERCLDEVTRALAQMNGDEAKVLQQAVYEQRDHIDELKMPALRRMLEQVEAGLAQPPEHEERLLKLLSDAAEDARREAHNVLGRTTP